MHTTLPTQASVDVDASKLCDNLVGLIQGVHASMTHVLGEETPREFGLDELLTISAVAFKNYVYEPDYNQLENPQPYSALGELVCNYGPFEAMGYFSGWDVKELNNISRDDFWKLLQYEIVSGRPVTTLRASRSGVEGTLSPNLVVGYRYERREQTLDVARPGTDEITTIDVTGVQDFQEGEPSFVNWMLIARPSQVPEWAPSHTRQRIRVLRWAAQHARRHKEFSQETRQNYAPGLQGFASFLGILDRVITGELTPDDELTRYLEAHVDGLVHARRAAAKRLPVWAAGILSDSELDQGERETVERGLSEAAEAYEAVFEALSGWQLSAGIEALRERYVQAFEAEKRAVDGLEEAVGLMPAGF